jgi:hypothetical protein
MPSLAAMRTSPSARLCGDLARASAVETSKGWRWGARKPATKADLTTLNPGSGPNFPPTTQIPRQVRRLRIAVRLAEDSMNSVLCVRNLANSVTICSLHRAHGTRSGTVTAISAKNTHLGTRPRSDCRTQPA